MVNDFYEQVYEIVRKVPPGRVTTNGAIAKDLGMDRSSRLVGTAMMWAPGLNVQAYRIINRKGLLTGKHHYETPIRKQELPEAEGLL